MAEAKSAEVLEEGWESRNSFFRRERHLSPDEPDTFMVESLKNRNPDVQ